MPRRIHVHFLPSLIPNGTLKNSVAVVIDILRASTTILHSLHHGTRSVIPCLTIDDAQRAAAQSNTKGPALLGGERGGEKIAGFDLDNSPTSYSRDAVGGRTIAFTTTNGTKALHAAADAKQVLIGAFSNLNAICDELISQRNSIDLVCAGTNGEISSEDVLFAGAVVDWFGRLESESFDLNDQARIAGAFYQSTTGETGAGLLNTVRESRGGRNLTKLGFDADISLACEIDTIPGLAIYDPRTREIQYRPKTIQ